MSAAGSYGVYLRWGGKRNRADDLARALGLELVSLRWQSRSIFIVPARYLFQFFQTLVLLFIRTPNIVVSQHTQPFCSLAALIYAKLTGGVVATDCHNGPFVDRLWQVWPISWLNRLIYRNTDINLVHNDHILNYVVETQQLPGKFLVLRDPIPDFDVVTRATGGRRSVTVICSFATDEPMEAMIDASRLTPEIDFFITGNADRLDDRLRGRAGENVTFTGFISDSDYDRMLRSTNVAMALSTRDSVLMRACHEVIGAEVPFVTTDIPVGREYLTAGTVFVKNAPEAIAAGIRRAVRQRDMLAREMSKLKRDRQAEWRQAITELRTRLGIDRETR